MIGTIADWRAYATERGDNSPTAASDSLATAALVRASDYITYTYVARFLPGYDETVPEVEFAAYEAATLELATPGFWSKTYTPSQQKVMTGFAAIKWTPVEGADSADAYVNATPTSTKIAAMLAKYLPGKFMVGLKSIGPGDV